MAIDRSGKWWKGQDGEDVLEYLDSLKPGGYPVDEVLHQTCHCGSSLFRLERDEDDELGKIICSTCKSESFLTDSDLYFETANFKGIKCPCRHKTYAVYLGVHSIEDPTVANWMSVGVICGRCGILSSPLDWEYDTEKSDPSYQKHTKPLPSIRR